MSKPQITTNCVANHYAGPSERIIEISSGAGGCLIGVAETREDDGTPVLLVSVYSADASVRVTGPSYR